jgi:CopG family nickel-responsive transcriptional regulator
MNVVLGEQKGSSMSGVLRFGVSIENKLLNNFDRLISGRGYATRSEALRDLMRDSLVQSRLEISQQNTEVIGSLTLIYDHHAHDLKKRMTEIQHVHEGLIISVMHVHICHDSCMEVIVLRGLGEEVRGLADSLLSLKGVKHGKLFVTLPPHIAELATDNSETHHHLLKG